MELGAGVLTAVVAFLLARTVWRGTRPPAPPRAMGRDDEEDLDARFAAIAAECLDEQGQLIAARVATVVRRGVPVRWVEPVAGLRSSRLHFADGTSVLARGEVPGDVAVLARAIGRSRVAPSSCRRAADGVHLHFAWGAHHGVDVVVTGLDQPD
jgi:hypothetical protein